MDMEEIILKYMNKKIPRKKFLKTMGIMAFLYIVGDPIAKKGQAIVTKLITPQKNKEDDFQYDLIFSLFGDLRKNSKFTPGTAHYLFPNKMHPDDVIASDVLARVGSMGIINLKEVDSFIDLKNLNGTIVALGSPMSNILSRSILSYKYVTDNPEDGIKRDRENNFFELPFEYAMDSKELSKSGTISKRMLMGKSHNVPNWSIWSEEQNKLYVPSVGNDGQLLSDYLLITVLPNIFSKESYESDEKIIIFGGTHGVATKSVNLLFKDKSLLNNLKSKSNTAPYWQALVEIDRVAHDPKGGRATPFSLSKKIICSPIYCKKSKIESCF
jgi:hypothetical protein